MSPILINDEPGQRIRMQRHLAALLGMALFNIVAAFYYVNGLFSVGLQTFILVSVVFWLGLFTFTFLIRSGINLRSEEPSLTVPQVVWTTLFFTAVAYMLNGWRGMILMAYFASISFGFFGLTLRQISSLAMVAVLEYTLVILYIFIYEGERIEIHNELLQLFSFAMTMTVMVYIGGAIHRLRDNNRTQRRALEQALELNRTLATTDELTGLFNRRYFMEKLAHQKAVSERDDSDFVICFFDLDHFKRINDTFGHHTGDVVLQIFASILTSNIREIDYAARFGGEEFVCLLVNTDIEQAGKVTERIREGLAEYKFHDLAPGLKATVSCGLANFRDYGTIQETLMSADNRMYRAKQLGRNLVVNDDDDTGEDAAVPQPT